MNNNKTKKGSRETVLRLARTGVLAALASIMFLLEFPVFPLYPWLKIDLSYVFVLLGGFSMGPLWGGAVLLIKDVIGLTHSSTAGIGELADLLVGLSLVLPAAFAYAKKRTKGTAVLGMGIGLVCMLIVSVLCNRFIFVPLLLGDGLAGSELVRYLTIGVLPFNIIKGVINCGATMLMYKWLRRARLL